MGNFGFLFSFLNFRNTPFFLMTISSALFLVSLFDVGMKVPNKCLSVNCKCAS